MEMNPDTFRKKRFGQPTDIQSVLSEFAVQGTLQRTPLHDSTV
jgi:hypothetical protein